MKVMYKVSYTIKNTAQSVEVERETDKFIFLKNGTKEAKSSPWYSYHETKEEAAAAFITDSHITSYLKGASEMQEAVMRVIDKHLITEDVGLKYADDDNTAMCCQTRIRVLVDLKQAIQNIKPK